MATKKPLGQGCVVVADPDQTEAQGAKKKIEGKLGPPTLLISRSGSGTVLLWWRKTKWQNISSIS